MRCTRSRFIRAALSAAACVVLAVPARAEVDPEIALVKNVTGSIVVHRGTQALPVVPGLSLQVADRLVSAPGASAGVVFKDGTLLTVGPATTVDVRDYVFEPKDAKYAFSVYLTQGSAIYSSGKIGKMAPESVRVATPTATVGVRGTRFLIEAQ